MQSWIGPVGLALMVGTQAGAAIDEAGAFKRSLVDPGDSARLQRVMLKAQAGEPVTVAVIGGSITAGAKASQPELKYGALIAAWWQKQFPESKITFVNAGIGATGSAHAAHRAQQHLLSHQPDFVVVEYAVNDGNTKESAETLEGLIRQILKQPEAPAIVVLYMMHTGGGNAQQWHSQAADHYHLPQVSFRDALWPEIRDGRIAWEDVEADQVHPNDRGHRYAAEFVIQYLASVKSKLPASAPPVPATPAPLFSDLFEYATFFNAETITPLEMAGFEPGGKSPFGLQWQGHNPGDRLVFEVEGTSIGLLYFRIKRNQGMASAQVDDRPPIKLQGWFDQDWGGYNAWQLLARGLPQGKHRVTITILDEQAEASDGHEFQVQALMAAGLPH